jgi:hypothetical protein
LGLAQGADRLIDLAALAFEVVNQRGDLLRQTNVSGCARLSGWPFDITQVFTFPVRNCAPIVAASRCSLLGSCLDRTFGGA